MNKAKLGINLLSLLLLQNYQTAMAEAPKNISSKPLGQINEYLRITGEAQASYEAWDYFKPNETAQNKYDTWVLRARLGVLLTHSFADVYAQAQYIGMYGLPTDAVLPPPIGALGLGGAYYNANLNENASNAFIRQLYINFKSLGISGLSAKVGRFEFMDCLEYKTNEKKWDNLKKARVGQRLLGSMAVHSGRTFDGFSMVYDQPSWNFTFAGFRPTQGAFTVQGQDEISDVETFYTALTSKKDALLPNTEGRLFYLHYQDERDNGTAVVDNRKPPLRPLLSKSQPIDLHTIGTHILSIQPMGSGQVDALFWGAYQWGDWTNLTQQAWAVDVELGYQWTKVPMKPWLRAIYYRSSGDNDANDSTHDTFFTALPSGRTFAKFPFYNLMNLQDSFVQLLFAPQEDIKVSVDFHHLQLAETNDVFYGGMGAFSNAPQSFGYTARLSNDSNDVGQMIDVTVTHTINQYLSWTLYYGHSFGGEVLRKIYPSQSNADTAHVDINLTF